MRILDSRGIYPQLPAEMVRKHQAQEAQQVPLPGCSLFLGPWRAVGRWERGERGVERESLLWFPFLTPGLSKETGILKTLRIYLSKNLFQLVSNKPEVVTSAHAPTIFILSCFFFWNLLILVLVCFHLSSTPSLLECKLH